jgi:hypothetical protein
MQRTDGTRDAIPEYVASEIVEPKKFLFDRTREIVPADHFRERLVYRGRISGPFVVDRQVKSALINRPLAQNSEC